MEVSLRNIGIIKSANIELNGLTILTGFNDIGKSYISRTIFSLINTITQSEEQFYYIRTQEIEEEIYKTYSQIRRLEPRYERNLREVFNPSEIRRAIFSLGIPSTKEQADKYFDKLKKEMVAVFGSQLFKKEEDEIENDRIIKVLLNNLEKIKKLILEDYDMEKNFKNYFNKIINNEFQGQINYTSERAYITFSEGNSKILRVEIEKNRADVFNIFDTVFYNNVILIETPIVLQIAKFVTTSLAFPRLTVSNRRVWENELPMHFTDLIQKLRMPSLQTDSATEYLNTISELIHGKIYYDSQEDSFYFEKKGAKFKPINTASGVKSFGIIQLLLKSGNINNKTVLVVDEPEVHLHPQWQKEYARLIVQLVKHDIPIIISSHSPYMIKALQVYSEKYDILDKTCFYLGETVGDDRVEFFNVTSNLEPIYKKLAMPMQELSFES